MRTILLLALAFALASCRTAWERHDESLYSAMKAPSHATAKAHAELLQQILRTSENANTRPPAGVNAEYAFYLAKLGRVTEAKTYLAKEARHYPEATTFLKAFERFLAGITPFAKEAKQ